ncbi:hypothetical protein TIFTF001_052304 [Ficus carica]|uniref:Uncharacterized protein n=1 Tax=Ficus carica TaxID=3494 RepID=A0AA88EIP2_FICCA|nr:hypothetical protein TIFTF001_052304 [Ficus carica]
MEATTLGYDRMKELKEFDESKIVLNANVNELNRVVIAEPKVNDFGEILPRIRLIKNIFKLHKSDQD